MPKTIRWGTIGRGKVCGLKRGPGFAGAEGSALSVGMGRNGERPRLEKAAAAPDLGSTSRPRGRPKGPEEGGR